MIKAFVFLLRNVTIHTQVNKIYNYWKSINDTYAHYNIIFIIICYDTERANYNNIYNILYSNRGIYKYGNL